ncbi:FG-GAP and VCBS repeat-containing protein [Sporichthya sp.]|uniref:FG-GAP and VCBS repeat-containing protein n=1 Tax=Sporichthya sp. TaxID=65475 RepID=UPI0018442E5E|nr:FG-GAP and VCBS repeat-containing protein [Sporichthya sp.]MBA3745478.1 FG-GAP repeat protein [Sporichthya sp.]
MALRSTAAVAALLTLTALAGPLADPAPAAGCGTARPGDLNGDGFSDLVVTEYGRTRLQGGIHVFYGTATGLSANPAGTAPDDQFLTQDSEGVPDQSENADEWGAALAVGDFNGDRCADVAVGAPGENETTGAVTVLYGSPIGLLTTGALLLTQNSPKLPDTAEPNDRFGAALTAGDFDGDGRADLAVGAPGETLGRGFGAGTVAVLWGAPAGLGAGRAPSELRPGAGVVGGKAENGDAFGAALAAGDITGDKRDELIVGAPGENGSGSIQVFPGGAAGFTKAGPAYDRSTGGIAGKPAFGDAFGAAVAAGDFNGDGKADVAAGIPGSNRSRGAVAVLYAGTDGLTGTGAQQWVQGVGGLVGVPAAGDRFGAVLATGRMSAGKHADLAIGIPGDAVATVSNAGAVQVLLGSASGLRSTGSKLLSQDTTGVGGNATTGDRFGSALAVRQIDGTGPASLIVGSPAEGTTGTTTQRCGAFTVFRETKKGPSGAGSQFWRLGLTGVQGAPAPGVFLGYTLA